MNAKQTPEDLLQSCLARCADGFAKRMTRADVTTDYRVHECETHAAVALLNAAARVAGALARLRGTTTNIRVTREGDTASEGSNGAP
jgi:hypothetical protein